jgi:hypothetical protein
MNRYPTVLADASRIRQFSVLAHHDVFRRARIERDRADHAWLLASVEGSTFGIPVLGGGRHFDAAARHHWREEHDTRVEHVRLMSATEQDAELERLRRRFRFGPLSERLVWTIHLELLRQRQSSVRIPDGWLSAHVWPDGRPANWRSELSELLTGLSLLHINDSANAGAESFGDSTSVLTDFQLGQRGDAATTDCSEECIEHGRGPHGHMRISVGQAFLGCLERLHEGRDSSGKRDYSLARLDDGVKVRRHKEQLLREIGRSGNLTSLFVPSKLGTPAVIESLTPRQQRLLQTLYRERTRSSDKQHEQIADSERFVGFHVPPIAANRKNSPATWIPCPMLNTGQGYCGFNGNRCRKGRGYRLMTWIQKAGYDSSRQFLDDLGAVAELLGLIVVSLAPDPRSRDAVWLNLEQLRYLNSARPRAAGKYHVRVYVEDDFMKRWCRLFGWELRPPDEALDPRDGLRALLETHRLTQKGLADALRIDRSDFSKMLRRKRPMPADLLDRANQWIASRRQS